MTTSPYARLITRITRARIPSLDTLAGAYDPRVAPTAKAVFFDDLVPLPPETPMKSPEFAAIGVRVEGEIVDETGLAARLAALAIERNCEIVALTTKDYSGLERFGFRTERIVGETEGERALCLEQIKRFWNIEIVI